VLAPTNNRRILDKVSSPMDIKIISSPTKLLVPGKLKFDTVKIKNINTHKGITCTSPP
jgi:hypothetical protein